MRFQLLERARVLLAKLRLQMIEVVRRRAKVIPTALDTHNDDRHALLDRLVDLQEDRRHFEHILREQQQQRLRLSERLERLVKRLAAVVVMMVVAASARRDLNGLMKRATHTTPRNAALW